MHWLFIWMQNPPDTDIPEEDWLRYLNALSLELLFIVLISAVLICGLYFYFSRRLTFNDLLRSFWPLRLLWLAIIPGIIVGIRALMLFDSFENLSEKTGAVSSAISSGLLAAILTIPVSW